MDNSQKVKSRLLEKSWNKKLTRLIAIEFPSYLSCGEPKFLKKNLNGALRAAVKGTNTSRLEDTLQCIEDLIRANANVNAEESEEGKTALMMACEKGYIEIVVKLLEQGALVDHKDQRKKTALFYAVENPA